MSGVRFRPEADARNHEKANPAEAANKTGGTFGAQWRKVALSCVELLPSSAETVMYTRETDIGDSSTPSGRRVRPATPQ